MRTVLLVTLGSRGDHEPFLSLAQSLLSTNAFDEVHFLLQSNFLSLLPTSDARLIAHTFPIKPDALRQIYFREYFKAKFGALLSFRSFDDVRAHANCLSAIIRQCAVPSMPYIYEIATSIKPSAIISASITASVMTCIAEKFQIPLWLVNFQPNTPTASFPYLLSSTENALRSGRDAAALSMQCPPLFNIANLRSYSVQVDKHAESLQAINRFRKELLLPPLTKPAIADMFRGKQHAVHVLNAYPIPAVPPCPDWLKSDSIYCVPSLADDYIPPAWDAREKCPELYSYFETIHGNNEDEHSDIQKPFCVNFGSMEFRDRARTARILFTALRAAGLQRVLMLRGHANLDLSVENTGLFAYASKDKELKTWVREHVFITDECPQSAWLMPRCSGLLCHGGAGTFSAGIRAEVPVVIAPFLCDQFFWAELCEALRIGAVARPGMQKPSVQALVHALKLAMTDDVRTNAKNMGIRIRNCGSGSHIAANIIANFEQQH